MPVYTLNPSHRRATKRKASRTPSLRERVAAKRRNPLSEDGAVVSNPRAAKGGRWVNVTLSTAKGQTIGEERYEHPWFGTYTFDEMALDMASRAPIGSIVTIRDGTLEDRYKVVDVPHLGGRWRGIQKMRRRNPLSEDGAVVSNPTTAYNVYLGTKLIDTVFQSGKSDADEVRRSLIDHDGYDHRIRVVKARRNNPLSEDGAVVSNPGSKFYVAIEDRAGEERTVWRGPFSREEAEEQAAHEREYWRGQYSVRVVSGDKKPKSQPRHFSEMPLPPGEEEYYAQRFENPAKRGKGKAKRGSKRSGGRTAAQSNAARAMKLFHSGKASSLAEAWDIIRSGR